MFIAAQELAKKLFTKENIRAVSPALAVLFANLIISTFITDFTYVASMKELWKIPFGFFWLLLLLMLPLFLLPTVCSGLNVLLNPRTGRFIQLQGQRIMLSILRKTGSSDRFKVLAWLCYLLRSF